MKTLHTFSDLGFDGENALNHIVGSSEYGNLSQLVASLALFSHPDTVIQTKNVNLFPVIRRKQFAEIGQTIVWKVG